MSKLLRETIKNNVPQEETILILDLGCGEKPYQTFFADKYDCYVGVDPNQKSLADVVAYGEHLPFRNDLFCVCLSTETFEHVTDPYKVTSEVNRVLKENGVLILSAPGIMPVHNYPNDYWRWTDQGFRKMLDRYFTDIKVQEVTTPIETLFQIGLAFLPTHALSSLFTAFINRLAELFGKNSLNAHLPRLISIYLVVARKRNDKSHFSFFNQVYSTH